MKPNLEMVHSKKYADAIKVASKFTAKNNVRLILTMVHHKANGDIMATDSHHAIIVKSVHGFKKDYMVNTKSLEFAKGEYPLEEDIFQQDTKTLIRLNKEQIRIWLQMHKSMNQLSKLPTINNFLDVKITKDSIRFEISSQNIEFTLPFEEIQTEQKIKISYDIELMRNALEAHVVLDSNELIIGIESKFRPIFLDNLADVKALVLPIRKN